MPGNIDEARALLLRRINEGAIWLALEYVLTADIDLRRRLEQEHPRVGRAALESVRVEQERERVQLEARAVVEELDGLIDLLIRAAQNE